MTDEIFDAMADRYRRQLLFELLDRNPTAVTRRVESDGGRVRAEDATVQRLHVHLPKLADQGFISWNRAEGVVMKGPRFEEIEPLLELLVDNRDVLPEN